MLRISRLYDTFVFHIGGQWNVVTTISQKVVKLWKFCILSVHILVWCAYKFSLKAYSLAQTIYNKVISSIYGLYFTFLVIVYFRNGPFISGLSTFLYHGKMILSFIILLFLSSTRHFKYIVQFCSTGDLILIP